MNKKFKIRIEKKSRAFPEYKLEIIKLKKGYISQTIGDAWKIWNNYRSVIIHCQTGSGKTTFVEDVLVKDAIEKGKKIIIVSNRIMLSMANQKRLLDKYGIKNNGRVSGDNVEYFLNPNIVVTTYQKLSSMLNHFDGKDFEYAVFDEAHYFTCDSTFSPLTGTLLNAIPYKFSNSKRIYISATPEEVIPHIVKAETAPTAVARYNVYRTTNSVSWHINQHNYEDYVKAKVNENYYASNKPLPVVYQCKENFKNLNLKFFENFESLKEKIISSKGKWVIFVTSKKFGKDLQQQMQNSIYIDADTKENNPEFFTELVEKESFKEKILITTSVFINGNNLKDDTVKNIVIFNTDICDIKQAIGRKRLSENETVNVYLNIPNKQELSYKILENYAILDIYNKSKKAPVELYEYILSDDEKRSKLRKILYSTKNGPYKFNLLAIYQLQNEVIYLESVKQMIEQNKLKYCKHIAKSFSLPFKKSMTELLIDGRAVIEKKLDEFVKASPVEEEEFLKISEEISDLRKKFGFISKSDNLGSERAPLKHNAFNKRLEEFNFQYKVEKIDKKYFCQKE